MLCMDKDICWAVEEVLYSFASTLSCDYSQHVMHISQSRVELGQMELPCYLLVEKEDINHKMRMTFVNLCTTPIINEKN